MKRTMACSSGNVSDFIRSEKLPSSSEVLESLWIPESSSSALRGGKSMVDFEDVNGGSAEAGGDTTVAPFFKIHCLDKEEINGYYDDFDGSLSNPPAKKRRLTASQVQFLEKHFEAENKLEPDRKIQLAKEVGLEPRQVAIWFQNRRARFKNQRLEKDYGLLKAAYDKLKADYDCLLKEKEGLQSQVVSLREKVLFGKHQENPEKHDSAITKSLEPETQHAETKAETKTMFGLAVCKQEDASSAASAKSEIFDSDSSHDTDGNHSSSIMEPEQSDFSQDEEDNITNHNNNIDNVNNVLFPPPFLLKLEEDCCFDDPPIGSCNLGLFSIDDQQQTPLWSWPYELEC